MTEGEKVTLHLIDPARGRTLQTWRFKGQELIRIGRSENNDVVIADAYVSRFHAELRLAGESWLLVNQGRHGVLIKGEKVERAPLEDGILFQLGPTGPSFRFELSHTVPALETTSIVSAMRDLGDVLQIDNALAERRVEEIAETPYFQKLQQFVEQTGKEAPAANKSAKATGK